MCGGHWPKRTEPWRRSAERPMYNCTQWLYCNIINLQHFQATWRSAAHNWVLCRPSWGLWGICSRWNIPLVLLSLLLGILLSPEILGTPESGFWGRLGGTDSGHGTYLRIGRGASRNGGGRGFEQLFLTKCAGNG